MIMIGYGANGYWMWDPVIKKVVLARSVIFDEHWQNREEKKTPYTLANNHIPSVNEKEIVVETKNTGMEQTRVNETRQSEDDQEQAIVIRSTRCRNIPKKLQNLNLEFELRVKLHCDRMIYCIQEITGL